MEAVVFVVGLVVLGVLLVLVGRLRARVLFLERQAAKQPLTLDQERLIILEQDQGRWVAEVHTQARLAAAAQARNVTELRALRDELTTARVGRSAAVIGASRAERRAETAPSPAEAVDDTEEGRATIAMPAPAKLPPKPSNDDGDATSILEPQPPMFAARSERLRPPARLAPLTDPNLVGSEDIADEAARGHLGPDDPTPARKGRAAILLAMFEASEGGA